MIIMIIYILIFRYNFVGCVIIFPMTVKFIGCSLGIQFFKTVEFFPLQGCVRYFCSLNLFFQHFLMFHISFSDKMDIIQGFPPSKRRKTEKSFHCKQCDYNTSKSCNLLRQTCSKHSKKHYYTCVYSLHSNAVNVHI